MTIAHLSDTHLGYRAYGRTTDKGINQREFDVMQSFRSALDQIAERDPDLIVHTGDMFHQVRPSNLTVIAAFRQLSKVQAKRGFKPFVILGGNHDTPRTSDAGNILNLFLAIEGVAIIAQSRPEVVEFPDLDCEVMGVASPAVDARTEDGQKYSWTPSGSRKHSVLALHGVATQALQSQKHPDRPNSDFDVHEANANRWTYVALGDFHDHQAYSPNCCYAGATEFTTSHIFDEARAKGWVWFDTEVGALEFVPVETRRLVDLKRIKGAGLTGAQITEQMLKNATWNAEEMPIVRQVVTDVGPLARSEVDQGALRELHGRCLQYVYKPWAPQADSIPGKPGERIEGVSLETEWDRFLDDRDTPPGLDKARVRATGRTLLEDAQRNDETDLA